MISSSIRIRSIISSVSQTIAQLPNHNKSQKPHIMPTPESAAFLAKKPSVPPTFSGVDYNDTAALKAAQDAIIREQWVKAMMFRLVGKELGKCYHREGVGHLEKCGVLRGMFFCILYGDICFVGVGVVGGERGKVLKRMNGREEQGEDQKANVWTGGIQSNRKVLGVDEGVAD